MIYYKYKFLDTKLSYQYRTFKVLNSNEKELIESDNPFAIAILSALYLLKSNKDLKNRLVFKKRLAKELFSRNWTKDRITKLLVFIEETLYLPEELESIFTSEVDILTGKEEETMGLSWEKTTYYKERYEKGKAEGRAEGRAESKAEGYIEGKVDGLLIILSKRFGNIPKSFRKKLLKLNAKELDAILEKALDSNSFHEIAGNLN